MKATVNKEGQPWFERGARVYTTWYRRRRIKTRRRSRSAPCRVRLKLLSWSIGNKRKSVDDVIQAINSSSLPFSALPNLKLRSLNHCVPVCKYRLSKDAVFSLFGPNLIHKLFYFDSKFCMLYKLHSFSHHALGDCESQLSKMRCLTESRPAEKAKDNMWYINLNGCLRKASYRS